MATWRHASHDLPRTVVFNTHIFMKGYYAKDGSIYLSILYCPCSRPFRGNCFLMVMHHPIWKFHLPQLACKSSTGHLNLSICLNSLHWGNSLSTNTYSFPASEQMSRQSFKKTATMKVGDLVCNDALLLRIGIAIRIIMTDKYASTPTMCSSCTKLGLDCWWMRLYWISCR